MKNQEIARIFKDIADLLEIKRESPFKVRAYQKVARAMEHLPMETEQLLNEDRLNEIPGVGEAISKKISELVATGKLEYYEKLKAEFPAGITTLLEIPGIGPKTADRLVKELNVTNIEELEKAINEGRVASLYRMGDKTAENILKHIQSLRRKDQRIPIGAALPVVEDIMRDLNKTSTFENITPAGSLRRFRETIGDIDLMGAAGDAPAAIDAFVRLPQVREVLARGNTKASVITGEGFQVDLRVVEHNCFGSLLQYFTGSKQHNINLREWAHRKGLKLSEYGITDLKTGIEDKFTTEEAFYRRLGLQYVPPEIREGTNEIELAEENRLPQLVELNQIKGDMHVHSDWSDGNVSIEEIALAAKEMGYEYIAITDHTAGRGIAHGLTPERLKEQIDEIKRLNQNLSGIYILTGAEVDIRADGSLDLPQELLTELDIVIAAVHSAMGQDKDRMTARVIKAIANRDVDIISHPTCRLIGSREPVSIDMEAVFHAAAKANTVMEINAMPDRLDLNDSHVFRARELGLKLAIGTDAHHSAHLSYMKFGVGIARRGWCVKEDILNTKSLTDILDFFKQR